MRAWQGLNYGGDRSSDLILDRDEILASFAEP
jgi:hypothetical protein